jgi:hypothetical protein
MMFGLRRTSPDYSQLAPRFEYEQRAVAFLDILGWKDLVQHSVAEPRAMNEISMAVGWIFSLQDTLGHSDLFATTQFSDSVVISVSLKPRSDRINPFFQLYSCCCCLSRLLMRRGIFLRGGVTDGLMYHSGSIAFGPALTAAYELESKFAVTPRIVTPSRSSGEPRFQFNRDPRTGFQVNFWRKDKRDNMHFLDFLASFSGVPECDLIIPGHPEISTRLDELANPIRTALIHQHDSERILAKYRWLAEYYNEVARQFGRAPLELLSTDGEGHLHQPPNAEGADGAFTP